MGWSRQEETGGSSVSDDVGTDALSVSEAIHRAKTCVKGMPSFVVIGEVTGFRGPNSRSGHCYFQVKDAACAMDCIVWRGVYSACGFELRDGLKIQVTGAFDVYEGSGRLSFIAKSVSVAGEGLLRQQVAELERRLRAEGLMDDSRKRPIPRFCTRVGVVTSLSGSVIDDVKRTLQRRNPLVELQVAGCSVQGPGAVESIERALRLVAAQRPDCILLVRGGGSFEDLMTFNDEGLARTVAACPVPVICGIGHEPDTSVCDLVCDRRASTPTGAAESVAPALDEIVAEIDERSNRLSRASERRVASETQAISSLADRLARSERARLDVEGASLRSLAAHRCLQDPTYLLDTRTTDLLNIAQRLHDSIPRALASMSQAVARDGSRLGVAARRLTGPHEAFVARAASNLDALSPLRVLARGYAIARDADGRVISSAADLDVGESIDVRLGIGSVVACVTEVRPGHEGTGA